MKRLAPLAAALLCGLMFGIGLIVSGMADPRKVLAFLDLRGAWDPSLAIVMGGAVLVGAAGFAVAARRRTSLLGEPMRLPAAGNIDRHLLLGGATFGVGWGLAGFCPGPALVAMSAGHWKAALFVAAMLAGMGIFEGLERRRERPPHGPGRLADALPPDRGVGAGNGHAAPTE